MVGAAWHCVVETELILGEGATRNDSLSHEPGPWGRNLTAVASKGHTLSAVAASGGISDGKECLEGAAGGDTFSVVEGLSSSVSPAGATIRLVTNEVDNIGAFGPLLASVKVNWEVGRSGVVLGSSLNSPFGINDGSHDLLDFLL